jgi:hypothetical protein
VAELSIAHDMRGQHDRTVKITSRAEKGTGQNVTVQMDKTALYRQSITENSKAKQSKAKQKNIAENNSTVENNSTAENNSTVEDSK